MCETEMESREHADVSKILSIAILTLSENMDLVSLIWHFWLVEEWMRYIVEWQVKINWKCV
jgi:hypothetical protein